MSENVCKVALDSEKVKHLSRMLKSIQNFSITQIILHFKDNKTLNISCKDESGSIYTFVDFNEEFLKSSILDDEVLFAIYDVSEFCSLLNIFPDGLGLEIKGTEATIKKSPNTLRYYGINPSLVKRPSLNGEIEGDISFKFNCDEMKPFIKAMNTMIQGFVIVNANNESNEIKFSITDKDIKTVAFETIMKLENIENNMKCVIEKKDLMAILNSGFSEFEVQITDQFAVFDASNEFYTQRTLVTFKL